MWRSGIAVMLTVLAVAACGEERDPATAPTAAGAGPVSSLSGTSVDPPPSTFESRSSVPPEAPDFPACDQEPRVEAPAGWYRDEPVYVGNEQPVDEVRAWARRQPGYEEIWVDRDHLGWITVAFSDDAAGRQADLEVEFPNVGVVAVEVPTTSSELSDLQRRVNQLLVGAGIEFAGSGSPATQWVVAVDLNASDERVAAALAPLANERICLNDTGVPIPEGPQVQGGEGWQLLGEELVGDSYRTGIATTEDQYRDLWNGVGMSADRPAVDLETAVVVWFGAVYGSSCPIRLDDVVVDVERQPPVVHAVTVVPGGVGACTADANPHAYIVALDRDRLPVGPFAIQLGAADPPSGVPTERTLVNADLSAPGAVATSDQIGPDPALIDSSREEQPVESGGVIEPGFPRSYRLDARCGIAVLGELNGVWWINRAIDPSIPPQWADLVDGTATTLIVEILMTPGPAPTVTATAGGHSVEYAPSAAALPCD